MRPLAAVVIATLFVGCGQRRAPDAVVDPPIPNSNVPAKAPGLEGGGGVDQMAVKAPLVFAWKPIASGEQGPGARSRHCFAYDRRAKATVLFGGIVWADGGTTLSDTWEFRKSQWFRIESQKHPPERHRGAMAYDARRGQLVLFGGHRIQGKTGIFLGDTWTYADERWSPKETGAGPAPRCGHVMAFNEESGMIVLFGGVDRNDRSLGDTWLFDGGSWRQVPGKGPPPRRYAALAYDHDLKGCVLHGGSEDDFGQRGFGDTWLLRGEIWTRMANSLDTAKNDDHGLAYHAAAQRLIMFGGLAGAPGVVIRDANGWRPVEAGALPPRSQCAPLAWDEGLEGVIFHGGETGQQGRQFDTTWVLQLSRR